VIFCALRDPGPTRITILIVLAVVYAVYHLVRWYMERPKVEGEDVGEVEVEGVDKGEGEGVGVGVGESVGATAESVSPRVTDALPPAVETVECETPGGIFKPEEIQRMITLGKAAWSAGWLVEANFWLTIARANGVHGIGARLITIMRDWQRAGCPDETMHVHDEYSPDHAEIAQAYMLFKAGIEQPDNAFFILSRMEAGSRTARTLALYERMIPEEPLADEAEGK